MAVDKLAYIYSRTEKTESCWTYKGGKRDGYGQVRVNGKSANAHRVVYELVHGQIPNGLLVLHKCDNRACVNPDHLFLGTHKDNAQDMSAKGRNGITRHNAKLKEEQIRLILEDSRSSRQVAADYGVSAVTIQNVRSGRYYRHITQ